MHVNNFPKFAVGKCPFGWCYCPHPLARPLFGGTVFLWEIWTSAQFEMFTRIINTSRFHKPLASCLPTKTPLVGCLRHCSSPILLPTPSYFSLSNFFSINILKGQGRLGAFGVLSVLKLSSGAAREQSGSFFLFIFVMTNCKLLLCRVCSQHCIM